MIFRPSDAEFQVELEGTKKCVHQKCPKDRVSNGKTEVFLSSSGYRENDLDKKFEAMLKEFEISREIA